MRTRADNLLKFAAREPLLFHAELDRLNGVRRVNRKMLCFVGVY